MGTRGLCSRTRVQWEEGILRYFSWIIVAFAYHFSSFYYRTFVIEKLQEREKHDTHNLYEGTTVEICVKMRRSTRLDTEEARNIIRALKLEKNPVDVRKTTKRRRRYREYSGARASAWFRTERQVYIYVYNNERSRSLETIWPKDRRVYLVDCIAFENVAFFIERCECMGRSSLRSNNTFLSYWSRRCFDVFFFNV